MQTPEQLLHTYEHNARTPSDINEHLPVLLSYYNQCDHVTEMGVRGGVSLSAALASSAKKVVAIDIANVSVPDAEKLKFICGDVLSLDIEETDFLFIDTWHTYAQCKAELERHGNKARKFIGFHDTYTFGINGEDRTRPALLQAIKEFIEANPHWVVDYVNDRNNGLTVLKRSV